MIAKIETASEYGKQGTTGINLMPEHTGKMTECFAHSTQDAIEYILSLPAFEGAKAETVHDGRFVINTGWAEDIDNYARMMDPDFAAGATHHRLTAWIKPMNTIHENVGFGKPSN